MCGIHGRDAGASAGRPAPRSEAAPWPTVVADASGASLPGATVTATESGTTVTRTAVTASDGGYSIPGLRPGLYVVHIELGGFRRVTHEGIRVATATRPA